MSTKAGPRLTEQELYYGILLSRQNRELGYILAPVLLPTLIDIIGESISEEDLKKAIKADATVSVGPEYFIQLRKLNWYVVKDNPTSRAAKQLVGQLVTIAEIYPQQKAVSVFTLRDFQNQSRVAIRIFAADLTNQISDIG